MTIGAKARTRTEDRKGRMYAVDEQLRDDVPTRAEVDALPGPTQTSWQSPARAPPDGEPLLSTAFADHPDVRHIKIEDGSVTA
jgi:hypothetical protein